MINTNTHYKQKVRDETTHRGTTHKLFARTGDGLGDITILVTLFSWLSGMEPTTDAQALPPGLALADNNLLHRVKTPSGLHLEKYELVPRWRVALGRYGLWFQHALAFDPFLFLDGVKLERATPLSLPELVI